MELILWAVPKGEPSWCEEVISEICKTEEDIKKVVEASKLDGWHSHRVLKFDGSLPDFQLPDHRRYCLITLRGGKETQLSNRPMTHKECMTVKSKHNRESQAYITVKEVK